MNKIAKTLICCLPFLGAACSSSNEIATKTVPNLDLEKFAGKWYEIGRYDHPFERDLVGCTANYSINDDGTITVTNAGYKKSFDGKFKESKGKARRPNEKVPGKLEVSFFLWFYSDYNVFVLADDYSYALIGSKSKDYLWILSRAPQMNPADISLLLQEASLRGYNIDRLLWVLQKIDL